jgi:hypothetical protein
MRVSKGHALPGDADYVESATASPYYHFAALRDRCATAV